MNKEFRLPDLFTAHPVGMLQIRLVLPIPRIIPVQRRLKKHPPVDLESEARNRTARNRGVIHLARRAREFLHGDPEPPRWQSKGAL